MFPDLYPKNPTEHFMSTSFSRGETDSPESLQEQAKKFLEQLKKYEIGEALSIAEAKEVAGEDGKKNEKKIIEEMAKAGGKGLSPDAQEAIDALNPKLGLEMRKKQLANIKNNNTKFETNSFDIPSLEIAQELAGLSPEAIAEAQTMYHHKLNDFSNNPIPIPQPNYEALMRNQMAVELGKQYGPEGYAPFDASQMFMEQYKQKLKQANVDQAKRLEGLKMAKQLMDDQRKAAVDLIGKVPKNKTSQDAMINYLKKRSDINKTQHDMVQDIANLGLNIDKYEANKAYQEGLISNQAETNIINRMKEKNLQTHRASQLEDKDLDRELNRDKYNLSLLKWTTAQSKKDDDDEWSKIPHKDKLIIMDKFNDVTENDVTKGYLKNVSDSSVQINGLGSLVSRTLKGDKTAGEFDAQKTGAYKLLSGDVGNISVSEANRVMTSYLGSWGAAVVMKAFGRAKPGEATTLNLLSGINHMQMSVAEDAIKYAENDLSLWDDDDLRSLVPEGIRKTLTRNKYEKGWLSFDKFIKELPTPEKQKHFTKPEHKKWYAEQYKMLTDKHDELAIRWNSMSFKPSTETNETKTNETTNETLPPPPVDNSILDEIIKEKESGS